MGGKTMLALTNALSVARTDALLLDDIEVGSFWWQTYAGISCFLVLFAGKMSGLTLRLMSLGLVDLEILQRSGASQEKKQAGARTKRSSRLAKRRSYVKKSGKSMDLSLGSRVVTSLPKVGSS